MRILRFAVVLVLVAFPVEQAFADNWGCDMVNGNSGLGFVDDCGSKGACCDAHDEGFRANNCTASSWFHLMCLMEGTFCNEWNACDVVNATAAACIMSSGPGPGPGLCCDFLGHNVCQSERNPNSYWGCVNDSWCDQHSRCNVALGVCEPICTNTTPTACGVSWTDSCGNTYTPIGCVDGMQCIEGRCQRVCTPYTCEDWFDYDPEACGALDDGCGGTVECGCADECEPWTCDDYGYDGTFWDGCYGQITCTSDPGYYPPGDDPGDDPWDPGDDGTGGSGCDSWRPSWCPYSCNDSEFAQ